MRPASRRAALALAALLVLAVAAGLRFEGVDWDGGHLLHPDERFLLMLVHDARLPGGIGEYLDAAQSPLNPHNLGREFYVYGTLPVTGLVVAQRVAGVAGWAPLARLGRRISAAADGVTVALVGLLAFGLAGRERGAAPALVAAGLYALCVLPIQAAHFFTTDPPLVLFSTGSLAAALFAAERGSLALAALAGLALGLATACKLPGLMFAPLVLAWLALPGLWRPEQRRRAAAPLGIAAVCAYLALRLGDPVFFASPSWLDPRPSPELLDGLAKLREWSRPEGFYPPAVQWADRTPGVFPLVNLAVFGLGLPHFVLLVLGLAAGARSGLTPRGVACFAWLGLLLFLSLRSVQSLRYFLPLLPLGMALAALPVTAGVARLRRRESQLAASALLLALLAAWPLAFRAIYREPHTRVRASEWIRAHAAPGSSIGHEHWDDRLPLERGWGDPPYAFRELPVFAPDSEAKWQRMQTLLDGSDLLVLSSHRGYASIGRVPEKYPRTARFYADLFAGRTTFRLEAEFTSFPTLFGISFDDQWAEEAFTVYDHPRVLIFRRTGGR